MPRRSRIQSGWGLEREEAQRDTLRRGFQSQQHRQQQQHHSGLQCREQATRELERHIRVGVQKNSWLPIPRVSDGLCWPGEAATKTAKEEPSAPRPPEVQLPVGKDVADADVVVVWFRQDLRLDDHPALVAASELGVPVLPIYIHEPESECGGFPVRGAGRLWVERSLDLLRQSLASRYSMDPANLLELEPLHGKTSFDALLDVIGGLTGRDVDSGRRREMPSDNKNVRCGEECAMCLESLNSGKVQTLPCSHSYHSDCIAKLRAVGIPQTCPICRADLPPERGDSFESDLALAIRLSTQESGTTLPKPRQRKKNFQRPALFFNRVYEPWKVRRDAELQAKLADGTRNEIGCAVCVRTFRGSVLYEPWAVRPDQLPGALTHGFGSLGFFRRAALASTELQPGDPLSPPSRLHFLAKEERLRTTRAAAPHLRHSAGAKLIPRSRVDGAPRNWGAGITAAWEFGEAGARRALRRFVDEDGGTMKDYDDRMLRMRADEPVTGQISPYMRFGELSPRRVMHEVNVARARARHRRANAHQARKGTKKKNSQRRDDNTAAKNGSGFRRLGSIVATSVDTADDDDASDVPHTCEEGGAIGVVDGENGTICPFLRKLLWRDLSYWMLWFFPKMAALPLRPQYEKQWWATVVTPPSLSARMQVQTQANYDVCPLRRWQVGLTGYPLVDAGMRQLWVWGWMPNYVRHICAQFLIEYLGIDWRHGEAWFHDQLVDADVAINAFMWQNGGHSGCDQWNFVMHPVYAAKSCDPEGNYVREWVPELALIPDDYVHCPWDAPSEILAKARVSLVGDSVLRRGMPVGLAAGRQRAPTGPGAVMASASTYPERIIKDLDRARQRCHDAVMAVRMSHEGQAHMMPCGNETLVLPGGGIARLITRADYFGPKPVVFQTPSTEGLRHDLKARRPKSVMGGLLHDEAKAWTIRQEKASNEQGPEQQILSGNSRGRGRSSKKKDPRFAKRWRDVTVVG